MTAWEAVWTVGTVLPRPQQLTAVCLDFANMLLSCGAVPIHDVEHYRITGQVDICAQRGFWKVDFYTQVASR